MDYSFLLGVHNITKEMQSTLTLPSLPVLPADDLQDSVTPQTPIATYSQYLRVIEFIKEQQESPIVDAEQIQVELNSDTASIQTVKADASPVIDQRKVSEEKTNDGIFNGTIWCNRKNLSRLTVFVHFFSLFDRKKFFVFVFFQFGNSGDEQRWRSAIIIRWNHRYSSKLSFEKETRTRH